MSVNEDWQEKLANSKIGREGRLWLLVKGALEREHWNPLRAQRRIADDVQNDLLLIRELCGDSLRELIERKAYERAKQVCEDRSGDALKRDEEQGQTQIAAKGHPADAPSSPAKPHVHPSLSRHTENGNGRAGQTSIAGNSQTMIARPAVTTNAERVKTDDERGQSPSADNGHLRVAPSSSVKSKASFKEPSAAQRKTDVDVERLIAKTAFKKVRLGNGKTWDDVSGHELSSMRRDGRLAEEVWKVIGPRTATTDLFLPLSRLMTEAEFDACVRRTRNEDLEAA